MKTRKCVYENCPAHYDRGMWRVPAGIEIPDTVLEHEHTTVGGQTFPEPEASDEAPHRELHGEFTEHGEAALKELDQLLTHNRHLRDLLSDLNAETELVGKVERRFTGHLLLVPDHEQRAVLVAIRDRVKEEVRSARSES